MSKYSILVWASQLVKSDEIGLCTIALFFCGILQDSGRAASNMTAQAKALQAMTATTARASPPDP
ncbi:MAG: hypothetical protein M3Y28_06750, partial [Armatimonadota bacterium]|nr:hypothetical protein [Armatimonadota bacterium]